MNERIAKLVGMTLAGEMYVEPIKTEYDREDLFLSPIKMSAKRVCEYILNQEPLIPEECCFTGFIQFDGSVIGDIFTRAGHGNFVIAAENFYKKPVDNLLTFEWQHSVANFGKIIDRGLIGIKEDIEKSKKNHAGEKEAEEFLETQTHFCNTVIAWAHKCSEKAFAASQKTENDEYRTNLINLSEALKKVPEMPAQSFYEAVLSTYVCYAYLPDSIGLIDRYLYPFYKRDIANGVLTQDRAGEYLQELFLMLQAKVHKSSGNFTRGGESHFCIGGYLENGEDGFNELSKLVVDSLLELPTWIPQISLRWTEKTPHEVLRYMLDCERRDPNKRIAFVSDSPRINGLMKYTEIPYKKAVNYTMIGCNELALPGGIVFAYDMVNILRSVENTFRKQTEEIVKAKCFDEFFAVYEKELFNDLWEVNRISKGFQDIRDRDKNIVSNIFIDGCIENAMSICPKSANFLAVSSLIGVPNVIDSLTVTKQFVFDEKICSMAELIIALKKNWTGYEDLRTLILKKGKFFGNDEELSNEIARRFTGLIDKWNNTENYLGKKWLFGNLVGYNEHQKFFGNLTKATPDGRRDGDMLTFGIGQTNGKDRAGLTALLNSVAKHDPYNVMTGPSVTNIMLDEQLIKKDESFEKLVYLFENYFKMGGTHFQLTYVSKKDLEDAQISPDCYKNLRVRVSGFSDYFVLLNKGLQDDIITRTEKRN